ncbi:MAG: hypothetical protein BRD57_03485 [Proteobacteria bacterium SW_6_67_9]|nr:MAG: hypothetical protein BRD57_03485 [Proteobacteria bacterium SW_6_67_9]
MVAREPVRHLERAAGERRPAPPVRVLTSRNGTRPLFGPMDRIPQEPRMSRTPSALMALAAASTMALASPVQAADLLSVYQRAEQEDAEFAQARAAFEAARQQWPQARAAVLPQVNFSASTAEVDSTNETNDTTTSFDRETYELELRQTLLDWGAFADLSRADAAVAQAEAELAAQRQDLIVRVAEAYFDVLTARDGLRFAQAEKRAVERQLEQARERFDVGLIPVTDVKEAQASFDLAVSRELEARNELDPRAKRLGGPGHRAEPGLVAGALGDRGRAPRHAPGSGRLLPRCRALRAALGARPHLHLGRQLAAR